MIETNTEEIYKIVSQLPVNKKMMLLSKLMLEMSSHLEKDKKLDIYDIKGIGKEIWKEIDAQDYVDKERESWK